MIAWSYFHALYEHDSSMTTSFLVLAPNLIVFERLKSDFGDAATFRRDPLIPPEWEPDFDLTVARSRVDARSAVDGRTRRHRSSVPASVAATLANAASTLALSRPLYVRITQRKKAEVTKPSGRGIRSGNQWLAKLLAAQDSVEKAECRRDPLVREALEHGVGVRPAAEVIHVDEGTVSRRYRTGAA